MPSHPVSAKMPERLSRMFSTMVKHWAFTILSGLQLLSLSYSSFCYAIGSNVDAAKLSGVSVVKTTTKTYLVSAFCSFVVGLILCGQAGMGNMEAGNMYEMYAVAAGVIGGISPLGGTGLLLGTLAGASVWQTLENGLNMIGAQVGIQRLVIGIIVVFAVLLDVVVRNGVFKKKPAKN